MASAAEQLAANINWSSFSKADELKKRIWFTLGALIVFRIGTYIPMPGINPSAYQQAFGGHSSGLLGMFDMFAGGAVGRMAIFALAIMPYISASIIIQLLTSVVPRLEALKKEGEAGRKIINQYTRYLTVVLATVQAYGIAVGLEGSPGVVTHPGWFFRLSTTITLVGGTMFLLWLGEQITSRGIGNGTSLIIQAGIVAEFPSHISQLFAMSRSGSISQVFMLTVLLLAVIVALAIVFFERAQRRVPIQYPKRQVAGNRGVEASSSHLPLKLNTAGVIPPIFASSLLLLPTTLAQFLSQNDPNSWLATVQLYVGHGTALYMVLYALLIIFFCFFYTAIVMNPVETADNLKKHGGFVPGIRPGDNTAKYIDYVVTRITVIGAIYVAVVCLLPEMITRYAAIPIVLGGTSLMITVSVAMDTIAQIHGHLLAHQYEGLIRKSKAKGGRR